MFGGFCRIEKGEDDALKAGADAVGAQLVIDFCVVVADEVALELWEGFGSEIEEVEFVEVEFCEVSVGVESKEFCKACGQAVER